METVGSLADLRSALSRGSAVVLKVGARWCGPCRALAPHFERLAVAGPPGTSADVVFAAADADDAPDVAAALQVTGLPTVVALRMSMSMSMSLRGGGAARSSAAATPDELGRVVGMDLMRIAALVARARAREPEFELPAAAGAPAPSQSQAPGFQYSATGELVPLQP